MSRACVTSKGPAVLRRLIKPALVVLAALITAAVLLGAAAWVLLPPQQARGCTLCHPGAANLPLPAYDWLLKCCHTFNLLDARGVISATERMAYILRVRSMAKDCCASYMETVVGIAPAVEEGEGE